MEELPYGEDINYWGTSKTSPDTWIDRACKLIEEFGGTVLMEAFGNEPLSGRAAYVLLFSINGDKFKIVWPVLPTRMKSGAKAARIQASTMLYRDVKAKCVSAAVLGSRSAFFSYLVLPDGSLVTEVDPETIPQLISGIV